MATKVLGVFEKKKSELDKLLNLNTAFVFYNSNFSNWFCTYLRQHKTCSDVLFIEEGLSAYYEKKEFDNLIKKRFYYSVQFRLKQILIWAKYKGEHTINPFKTWQRIQQSSSVFSLYHKAYQHKKVVVIEPRFEYQKLNTPIEILIAPSALCLKNSFLKSSEYTKGFHKLLLTLSSKGYCDIGIKYHPRQNPDLIVRLNKTAQNLHQINLVEIEQTSSIESLIASNNLILITDISSVAIYNTLLNNKTYTYRSYLSSESSKFKNLFNSLPAKLRNILIDINLLENSKLQAK